MESRLESENDTQSEAATPPSFERICISSGGSLMLIYAGVYHAARQLGLLRKMECVAGNSAGAVFAAMIAIDIHPRDLYRAFRDTDFTKLLGEPVGAWFKTNPLGSTPLTHDGKFMLHLLRNVLTISLKKTLAKIIAQNQNFPVFLAELFAKLQKPDAILTFNDLAQLHAHMPERFKKLYCETVTLPKGERRVFSAATTPEVDIALACCASSAVPCLVVPAEINGEKHIDGGVFNFVPLNCFDHPHEKNLKIENTLVCVFEDESLQALLSPTCRYQPSPMERFLRETVMPWFTGLEAAYTHTEAWNQNYDDLVQNYTENTIKLSTCGIYSLNFYQANASARQLYASGYLDLFSWWQGRNPHLDFSGFCQTVIESFNVVYQAVMAGANRCVQVDAFSIMWNGVQNGSNEVKFNFLHCYLQANVKSIPAIALSLALEFITGLINAEELCWSVYETAFDHSSIFAPSRITGSPIYTRQALRVARNACSFFNLPAGEGTRRRAVLDTLHQLPGFTEKFQQEREACQLDNPSTSTSTGHELSIP